MYALLYTVWGSNKNIISKKLLLYNTKSNTCTCIIARLEFRALSLQAIFTVTTNTSNSVIDFTFMYLFLCDLIWFITSLTTCDTSFSRSRRRHWNETIQYCWSKYWRLNWIFKVAHLFPILCSSLTRVTIHLITWTSCIRSLSCISEVYNSTFNHLSQTDVSVAVNFYRSDIKYCISTVHEVKSLFSWRDTGFE